MNANVKHEVFSEYGRTDAGKKFFEWINCNKISDGVKLINGGKLTQELSLDNRVLTWLTESVRRGRIVRVADWVLKKAKDKAHFANRMQAELTVAPG